MITKNQWIEISKLLESFSVPEVSRRTNVSTTTIYRLLKMGPAHHRLRSSTISRELFKYKKYLDTRIRNGVFNVNKLLSELKEQGYKGSYAAINKYFKSKTYRNSKNSKAYKFPLRKLLLDPAPYKPSVRFETGPGEQAQVDWGSFGKIEINGRLEKLSCFVYVLGYSRIMYMEFTIKQNLQTLENCHIHAFEALGIPKVILYDNMKTVVLRREKTTNGRAVPIFNPAFLDFAHYYGFKVEACPTYWPRAKGKVESGVKYIRNNFIQGMKFKKESGSLENINQKANIWLEKVANCRLHGTTGARPIDLYEKERKHLNFPINIPPYSTSPFLVRISTKDGLVQYKSNFYSVPIRYTRRKLFLREINNNGVITVVIYHENKMIAEHNMSYEKGQWIINESHAGYASNNRSKRSKRLLQKTKTIKPLRKMGVRSLSYYNQLIQVGKNG